MTVGHFQKMSYLQAELSAALLEIHYTDRISTVNTTSKLLFAPLFLSLWYPNLLQQALIPSLWIKIEMVVILASLVSDLRLLNGISVSRFLQCYINLGSSFQYQNYFILLLCRFLSMCFCRHSQNSRFTLGWKSVHNTRSTVSICVAESSQQYFHQWIFWRFMLIFLFFYQWNW